MKIPLKKRTDAFARFLVRKKKYESGAKGIQDEIEKSNLDMARLAKKFQWWGSMP